MARFGFLSIAVVAIIIAIATNEGTFRKLFRIKFKKISKGIYWKFNEARILKNHPIYFNLTKCSCLYFKNIPLIILTELMLLKLADGKQQMKRRMKVKWYYIILYYIVNWLVRRSRHLNALNRRLRWKFHRIHLWVTHIQIFVWYTCLFIVFISLDIQFNRSDRLNVAHPFHFVFYYNFIFIFCLNQKINRIKFVIASALKCWDCDSRSAFCGEFFDQSKLSDVEKHTLKECQGKCVKLISSTGSKWWT